MKRRIAWAAVIAGAAIAGAGCGGDDGGGGTGGGGSGGASSAQLVGDCQGMIDEAKKPLEFKPPGEKLDASKLRGKRVMFVSLTQAVPAIALDAKATQEAGKEVGIEVDVFDTKGDVRRMQQGINQAVDQRYDAIILLGIPLAVTQPALEKAKKAGIPVISELNNEPKAEEPGQGAGENVFGTTGPPRFKTGQLVACKAVVDTDGKANAVIFGAKELEPSAAHVAGMRDILEKCDSCTVDENSTPTAEWQTKLPGLAQSEIRRNPNVNYLLPLYDGMALFVVPGVRQAGAADKVKVASFNATPAALELIKRGEVMSADPGQPNSWMAWQGLDQAMRGMLKMEPGEPVVPVRFFDEENLQDIDVNDEDALFGSEFRDGFRQLWGVGGSS